MLFIKCAMYITEMSIPQAQWMPQVAMMSQKSACHTQGAQETTAAHPHSSFSLDGRTGWQVLSFAYSAKLEAAYDNGPSHTFCKETHRIQVQVPWMQRPKVPQMLFLLERFGGWVDSGARMML